MTIRRIPYGEKSPPFHITIEEEFTVIAEAHQPAQKDEAPLYYEPDGQGGMRFVYADKPPARSWTL